MALVRLESMPPLQNVPSGTSDMSWRFTARLSTASSASVAARKSPWKGSTGSRGDQ